MAVLLSILPFFSTVLGGVVVLRLRHRLHPIMGFAAGVVVATALADLVPEANDLVGMGHGMRVGGAAVAGYLAFSALEAFVHQESWEHQHPPFADPDMPHEHAEVRRSPRTLFSLVAPAGLIVHSTLDGLAIGLAFQAGSKVGLIVALAVVAHDFADGMNVVTLAFTGGRSRRTAIGVLMADAIAPVMGAAIGSVIALPDAALGALLAFFAGVFVAIGAGHLLPEAQHRSPRVAPMVIGMAVIGAVVAIAIRSIAA